jgi:hypothetical protein
MDYSVLTWGSSDAGGYSGAERAQLFGVFEGVRELTSLIRTIRLYKPL